MMRGDFTHPLLELVRGLHRRVRATVLEGFDRQGTALAEVAEDGAGDTLYGVDKLGERSLIETLRTEADAVGGIVLLAEGLPEEGVALPEGRAPSACRYRMIVDPIDGTRGLMYQKRSAWVLTGVAPNLGDETRLSDVELAVQTEIPTAKQRMVDELWALRGSGARAERVDLTSGARSPLPLSPSRATGIEHGFASISRFFPGGRDVLAAIDDALVFAVAGTPGAGKAHCFEDQYASSGGQLYELAVGHDRFIADLRPLLAPVLADRGLPGGLCCHPYDVCTALIAEEAGVVVRDPRGGPLDVPLDLVTDVAWVGYANAELARRLEPVLLEVLERHGLLGGDA